MRLFLAACAAAIFGPRADTLSFAVAQGTKIDKTCELSVELESRHVWISLDGKELPKETLDKFEMSMSNTIELAVQDEYTALTDGRPTALVRRFGKVTSHVQAHEAQPGSAPKANDE